MLDFPVWSMFFFHIFEECKTQGVEFLQFSKSAGKRRIFKKKKKIKGWLFLILKGGYY